MKKIKFNKIIHFIKKQFQFRIITHYILKEFLFTCLICFFFFIIIFIINDILVSIKPLLEKDIPANLVFMLLFSFFPFHIIMSLPFGVMLATLMVMGRYSSDNEIVAFRALGFHFWDIFKPIFVVGIILTLLAFFVNDQLVPVGLKERKITEKKIRKVKPTLDFQSETVKTYQGKIIFTDQVKDNKIEGLLIIDWDKKKQRRIITSPKASINTYKNQKGVMELKMENPMIQMNNTERKNDFNYGYSDSISYLIKFYEFDDTDYSNVSGNEKSVKDILKSIKHTKNIYQDKLLNKTEEVITIYETLHFPTKIEDIIHQQIHDKFAFQNFLKQMDADQKKLKQAMVKKISLAAIKHHQLELYRKFTFPLACIVFIIFAAPIGIYSRRAGYSIGFVLGLFLTALYWFTFYGCIVLGRKDVLPPFIAMALPNLIFLVIGIYFFIKRLQE
ncbi:MAG: LptF/LptG family permease [Spirochaetes bacterium]|nr:LptF/LptG family permease [Spirochaetota bacterium]